MAATLTSVSAGGYRRIVSMYLGILCSRSERFRERLLCVLVLQTHLPSATERISSIVCGLGIFSG
jgi:hypothetical protein